MIIGSIVRFADSFLDDIGATAANDSLCYAVGIVLSMDENVATVKWNSARIGPYCAVHVLSIVS